MPEGSDSQHVPTPDVFPSEFVPEPPSEPASESAPVNTSTLCLRALEVHHGAETWTLNRMMDWADSGRFVLAIEKLSLHAHFYDDWTYALYDILARSDELRSLEIIDYNSIATYLGPLDFSNLHSLQDLTCDVRLPTDIARSVLPHIVESIATLRSRSFHSLVISVRAPGSPLEDFLREMGTAFNKVVIDRLTELHLRYEKKREPLDVNLDDLTNELFGALKRRGVAVKLFTESYDQLLAPKQ
ncbi:hypothetical protein PUNSTDRAFT_124313 [Punctularia strigosozonata HHB-11173 SS5]|uniref:uncharacterized protein n=1 Tax=Punctularia strigosozonata (strain HHB-11173) TaxID=741275 RepID=UPI0004417025|nr:uncharacterized protein PUNSTDRAFT_124313 [Punctularia strigosozonata HHB-11173 SS5]EIN12472.1 hypothetical protein PUNSTDRAFT_124313 [Punctularia strigosozonata HHB-11173 SS5]